MVLAPGAGRRAVYGYVSKVTPVRRILMCHNKVFLFLHPAPSLVSLDRGRRTRPPCGDCTAGSTVISGITSTFYRITKGLCFDQRNEVVRVEGGRGSHCEVGRAQRLGGRWRHTPATGFHEDCFLRGSDLWGGGSDGGTRSDPPRRHRAGREGWEEECGKNVAGLVGLHPCLNLYASETPSFLVLLLRLQEVGNQATRDPPVSGWAPPSTQLGALRALRGGCPTLFEPFGCR